MRMEGQRCEDRGGERTSLSRDSHAGSRKRGGKERESTCSRSEQHFISFWNLAFFVDGEIYEKKTKKSFSLVAGGGTKSASSAVTSAFGSRTFPPSASALRYITPVIKMRDGADDGFRMWIASLGCFAELFYFPPLPLCLRSNLLLK